MDLKDKLAIFIENGVTQQHIADISGVDRRTLIRLLSENKNIHQSTAERIENGLIKIVENLTQAMQQ